MINNINTNNIDNNSINKNSINNNTMNEDNKNTNENIKAYNEIWDDLIQFTDLLIALFITISFTAIGYYFAPKTAPLPLFISLAGALVGFVVSSLVIKPKRQLVFESQENKEE